MYQKNDKAHKPPHSGAGPTHNTHNVVFVLRPCCPPGTFWSRNHSSPFLFPFFSSLQCKTSAHQKSKRKVQALLIKFCFSTATALFSLPIFLSLLPKQTHQSFAEDWFLKMSSRCGGGSKAVPPSKHTSQGVTRNGHTTETFPPWHGGKRRGGACGALRTSPAEAGGRTLLVARRHRGAPWLGPQPGRRPGASLCSSRTPPEPTGCTRRARVAHHGGPMAG